MLKPKHLDLLNRHIDREFWANIQYHQMALWAKWKGLDGIGGFLQRQADQELFHRNKMIAYVMETGGLVRLGKSGEPIAEFKSVKALFTEVMRLEREVTASINEMAAITFQDKDFSTFNFLQWYVTEQHEEEHIIQTILDRIELIGEDKKNLFWLDKEIGAITAPAAPGAGGGAAPGAGAGA